MELELLRLLDFCSHYDAVICYGAAEHGYTVKHFLESQNVKVAFFLISDKVDETERDGIPLHCVHDIGTLTNRYGVVLSLYEHHQPSVKKILASICNDMDIYSLKDKNFQSMRLFLMEKERIDVLCTDIREFDKTEIMLFDLKLKELKSKYKGVVCRYFNAGWLGEYVTWAYHCSMRKRNKDELFYLYYPVGLENHKDRILKGANEFLLSCLNDDGIAVISEKNLHFWQFVLYKNSIPWSFENNFSTAGFNVARQAPIPSPKAAVRLTQEDMMRGEKLQKELGLRPPYVCVSNRDIAFMHMMKRDNKSPYMRDRYRNSDIRKHKKAIDYLKSKDIMAVRMGAAIEETFAHPNLVEYASKARNEFMDVYLSAGCRFFVADLSGILAFPMLLSKSMVVLNAPVLTTINDALPLFYPTRDIVILKKLWDSKNKRYLTLRDMLKTETNFENDERSVQWTVFGDYQRRGIIPIDNTEDEIADCVKEMNERIEGTVHYDALDIELQAKYREIVDNYPMKDNVLNNWRLGAAFLRENQWLLD